jgi:phosphoribosylformylglycinamidine synthase subunit PurS
MKFRADIHIMPHKGLLDPQGKTVSQGLHKMGHNTILNVRIGKMIQLEIEANSESEAKQTVSEACEKLLVNKIMEQYTVQLSVLQS